MSFRFRVLLAIGFATPTVVTRAHAQEPLIPLHPSGQTVTPAFEGWYKNADGTYSISFGYLNRNGTEVVEIPIGPDNHMEPGNANQGQPTSFQPRRNWGVFVVRVPANFGKKTKVTWVLKNRGETYTIAGSLDPLWEIDALEGEAGSGNTPPLLRFGDKGPEGRGPGGPMSAPITAKVGVPVALSVWASDDGRSPTTVAAAAAGRGGAGGTVSLAWFKHQGPGDVVFASAGGAGTGRAGASAAASAGTGRVPNAGGTATTSATFSAPGDYIIRVRANDASGIAGAGHAQCCWSNGFIQVTVTK